MNSKTRYDRQKVALESQGSSQEQLTKAKILVIGSGGLGSPILYYLASAGVGTIGIMDFDVVDLTNLNRQFLHWPKDVGTEKTASAYEKLRAFNPEIHLHLHNLMLDTESARAIFPQYDVVIAAVDNMETRYIINAVCWELGKPWVDGGVRGYNGTVMVFTPPFGPCYQCLYPKLMKKSNQPSPSLLGVIPGVIGVLAATEGIKLVTHIGEPLVGQFLLYDALDTSFRKIKIPVSSQCPICSLK